MQFNVSQLLREPIGSRRQYVIEERFAPPDSEEPEVELEGPVDLLRTDRGVLAQAVLVSRTGRMCDRCLAPVELPVRLLIEEEFLPSVNPVTGAILAPPKNPEIMTIDQHHVLDLTEAARQAWLLAVPMQTLCRENCEGLCPTCGLDRNAGACYCVLPPIDRRWAVLAAMQPLEVGPQEEN
ncbi:MAG: YceD family protein [Dehalococcoidia bacterium]